MKSQRAWLLNGNGVTTGGLKLQFAHIVQQRARSDASYTQFELLKANWHDGPRIAFRYRSWMRRRLGTAAANAQRWSPPTVTSKRSYNPCIPNPYRRTHPRTIERAIPAPLILLLFDYLQRPNVYCSGQTDLQCISWRHLPTNTNTSRRMLHDGQQIGVGSDRRGVRTGRARDPECPKASPRT